MKLVATAKAGFHDLGQMIGRNKEKIALTAAIIGVPTTGYLGFRAGLKAAYVLDQAKADLAITDEDDKETRRAVMLEAAKAMAPIVLPPLAATAVTEAAIISGHKFALAAQAGLTAACKMSEDALEAYKQQVRTTAGDDIANEVDKNVATERFNDTLKNNSSYIIETGNGGQLFQDFTTGIIFRSSIPAIEKAISECNFEMMNSRFVSLGEYLDANKLPSWIGCAEELGWCADWGLIEPIFEPIALPNDETAYSVRFRIGPRAMYKDGYRY